MRRHILNISLIISLITGFAGYGQEESPKDVDTKSTDFFISAYLFHPELLSKGKFLLDLNAGMPKYFKYYNPMKQKIDKKMPVVVINDAYFNAHLFYGLTKQINLYATIPFVDSHHYSPMIFQEGVGFGDVETGLVYGNLLKDANHLTLDAAISWPTGIHKHQMPVIDTGTGAFGFKLAVNGLMPLQKGKKDAWQMAYNASYKYLLSIDKIDQGYETGAFLLFQKPYHTAVGYFGLENGLHFQYQAPDTMGTMSLPNSELTQLDVNIGGWYEFLDRFYLRFSVPYTVYQNKAYLTKYNVILQLDYLFN